MHVELPLSSFICAALSLLPLPWHWRSGTIPTIALSLWLFVSNLINGINAIIWADNVHIVVPVWCDISTKIIVGANIALPASVFCLCIHLERVSSLRHSSTARGQRRRRQYVDGFLCFGVPLIYMALHYIVQGHRFDIIEVFGCRAATYVSIPAMFLLFVPVLFFSFATLIISGLAFRNFWIRRISFARHLQVSNSALTPSRYFRLMAMSVVQMFWGLAIAIFNIWFTFKSGLRPWTGWADVHSNFSRIALFPEILIPPKIFLYTYLLWWSVPISALLFFAFFSFGHDAMKEYRACYVWMKRHIFHLPHLPLFSEKKCLPSSESKGVSLSSIGKPTSPTKSEVTLPVSSDVLYTAYKWDPPMMSPTSDTTTLNYPPNEPYALMHSSRQKDLESDGDAHSISTYRST